jgi:hypothetical protein
LFNETINENVTSLAGVPSWMLVLLQKALETTGKSNLLELWPNAEVYFHGGVNFDPYREQYKNYFQKRVLNIMKFIMLRKDFLPFKTKMILMNYY